MAATLTLAAAIVPLGTAAEAEAGTKDAATDGYARTWSFSSGGGEYDPMLTLVEAGADGTVLYAKRNLFRREPPSKAAGEPFSANEISPRLC